MVRQSGHSYTGSKQSKRCIKVTEEVIDLDRYPGFFREVKKKKTRTNIDKVRLVYEATLELPIYRVGYN